LYRSTSEKEPVSRVELEKNFPSTAKVVLNCLGLIKYHVMPFYSQKLLLVFGRVYNKVVGSKKNIDPHVRVVQVFRV